MRVVKAEELLERIYEEGFNMDAITSGQEIWGLLTPRSIENVEKRIQDFRIRAYLDEILNRTLDHLGLAGPLREAYRQFAHEIVKSLRRNSVADWPKLIEAIYVFWTKAYDLDPKMAKITALVAAKAYYQLAHGKLETPIRGEERSRREAERGDDQA